MRITHVVGAFALVPFTSCSDGDPTPVPTGPGFELQVGAMTLPGVGVACYDLEVRNASGVVWAKGDPAVTRVGGDADAVCSDRYGNGDGGEISYIGPCDATSDSDAIRAGVQNDVTLWVDGLYDAAVSADIGQWQDPCPAGCTLAIDCDENQDTFVAFNLTVMRAANQGFFDVAVNFDDIFCSAKLDTCYDRPGDTHEPIRLLHDAHGVRSSTAVLALACTAGAGADIATTLYMDKVQLVCDDVVVATLNPSIGSGGNAYALSVDGGAVVGDPDPTDGVFQYATYTGTEDLECGQDVSCNKLYWNVAIGLEPAILAGEGCHIVTQMTATEGLLTAGLTPAATTYPVIAVDVAIDVEDVGGTLQLACTQNPLNGTGSAVVTTYTPIDAPASFCYSFNGTSRGIADATCQPDACGDGTCAGSEDCASCPQDCGPSLDVRVVEDDCDGSGDSNFFDLICTQDGIAADPAYGVAGVEMTLTASGGGEVVATAPSIAGPYTFAGLETGCYEIAVGLPVSSAYAEPFLGELLPAPYEVCLDTADTCASIVFMVDINGG